MKLVNLEGNVNAFGLSQAPLQAFGELVTYENTSYEEIPDRIRDAEIVIINKSVMDAGVLAGAQKLRLICEAATGYNNVDIDYCRAHGIAVANVSGYSTDCVAQHTFAMLLSLLEHLPVYDRYVKDGNYGRSREFSHLEPAFQELSGKKFGIVGLGNIGQKVARIAEAFGAEVLAYSASGKKYALPYRQVTWQELLSESDVISVHCPLTERTRNLFDYEAFWQMKPTAIFLNLARGPVVCAEDLVRALEKGLLYGAGLDVFEREPLAADSPLLQFAEQDRLLLTPHIGWGSVEARARLLSEVAENIRAFLAGKKRNRVDE